MGNILNHRAVIFDLDGTLCDTLKDLADATNYALRHFGYPPRELEEYRYFVGNGAMELIRRAMPQGQSEEECQKVYDCYIEYYGQHYLESTRPYDQLPEVVQRLKSAGFALGVVTNKPDFRAREIVGKFYPGLFDRVQGHTTEFPHKPDPALTNDVLASLGAPAQNSFFVGDSGVDMQTARNAGLTGIGVLWGFRDGAELSQNGAAALVSTAQELLDILLHHTV